MLLVSGLLVGFVVDDFFVDGAFVAFVAFLAEVLEAGVVALADLDFRGVFEVGFSFVSTGFVEVSSFFDSFAFVSDRVVRFFGTSWSSASSAALRRFGGILALRKIYFFWSMLAGH